MTVERALQALDAAAEHTARYMTGEVRHRARVNGWSPEATMGLKVEYQNGSFAYNVADHAREAVHTHEYGTESELPKPVLRTYSTRTHRAENHLIKRAHREIGGLL